MKHLTVAAAPVYTKIEPHNLMQHWLSHRPTRIAEPTVQDAVIVSLNSCVDVETLKHATLFKGVSATVMKPGSQTYHLLDDQGKSEHGYYSTDVCRALTFVVPPRSPVVVGSKGYLLICNMPWGETSDDRAGSSKTFNNDVIYSGAHVLAYAIVRITRLGRS